MMEKYFLTVMDLSSYKKSYELSNEVWDQVITWDYFAKDTVGKQFVRACDSVSANIAEGFGRYTKKDKVRFYRISIGSLEESGDWLRKSFRRELIGKEDFEKLDTRFKEIKKEIFHLIKFTNEKLRY